jgi:hypothetical protein
MPFTKLLPTSIDLAQNFTFTGTVAGAGGGKVLQVVNAQFHNNNVTTSSSFADTSVTAQITPSATNSKVLVFVNIVSIYVSDSDTNLDLRLYRSGGASGDGGILDFEATSGYDTDIAGHGAGGTSCVFLDSPAVTSAVTYKCQFASSNNTHNAYINHWVRSSTRPKSTITLMEIAN